MELISIATMIKNESPRLKEWILFYHLFHNINIFHFYLDNTSDNPIPLFNYLQSVFHITIISENSQKISCNWAKRQFHAFHNAASFAKSRHLSDWLLLIDVDEFITPININAPYSLSNDILNLPNNIFHIYFKTYNFNPAYINLSKPISNQDSYFKWSDQERISTGHGGTGKSILNLKNFIPSSHKIDIHGGYNNGKDILDSSNFSLLHFKTHTSFPPYSIKDDSIKSFASSLPMFKKELN